MLSAVILNFPSPHFYHFVESIVLDIPKIIIACVKRKICSLYMLVNTTVSDIHMYFLYL
jgi:hypothetical protein